MPENKYRVVLNGSVYDVTETNGVSYKVVKDSRPYGSIDLTKASKDTVVAFQLGIFFGSAYALEKQQVNQSVQGYPANYGPNQQGYYNQGYVQANGQGFGQPVYGPAGPSSQSFGQPTYYNQGSGKGQGNKVMTMSNGHSILGNDSYLGSNNSNGGFINKVILALIAGVGIGAILSAVYIFINLGKVTVNL